MADTTKSRRQPLPTIDDRAPGDRAAPGLVCGEERGAVGPDGDGRLAGGLPAAPAGGMVRGGDAEADRPAGELQPAPWDALKHHPRYGYPPMTPEQLAEIARHDQVRWERSGRRIVRRPARSRYLDPHNPLRLR